MIKVHFEYDDGAGCKTSYCKECGDDCREYEGELETLNRLYLEFLMACGFPFTYKDEVVVVEEGDLEIIETGECMGYCDHIDCSCEKNEDDEDIFDLMLNLYADL